MATMINGSRIITGTINYAAAGGASNAYTLTLAPALTAVGEGLVVWAKANHTCTGSATMNVNGTGAVTIKKHGDQNLASGDIENGQIFGLSHDGTNWQIFTHLGNAPAGGGGSALTSNAGDAYWAPWGNASWSGAKTLTANRLVLQSFWSPVQMQFRQLLVHVTAGSAAGTGSCGGIYTRASNGDLTLVAQTEAEVTATAETYRLDWVSGSLVSGGVLTLPAGQNYYLAFGSEGAPAVRAHTASEPALTINALAASVYHHKGVAYRVGGISGAGTSAVCEATITNANVVADNTNLVFLVLQP